MKFFLFMNYIMLIAICGNMGIIEGDLWLNFAALGVIALIISIVIDCEV